MQCRQAWAKPVFQCSIIWFQTDISAHHTVSLLCFLQFSLQTRDKKYKEQQKRFSQWYLQGQRDWNSQITKTVIAGQNSALLYCWGHSNSHAEQCAYSTLTMPGPPLASRSGHHSVILGSCEQCHNCNDGYHPRPASASFFSPPACSTCGLPPCCPRDLSVE